MPCDCDALHCTTYDTDIDTSAIASLGRHDRVVIVVSRDDIIDVFIHGNKAVVIVDRMPAGHIDVKCRSRYVSGLYVGDRWRQQINDDIYVIDSQDRLQRISWHDVKARRYFTHVVVDSGVEDFYIHDQGNDILMTTGTLVLNDGRSVNMQDAFGGVK